MSVVALVLAAGRGQRLGALTAKAFVTVGGRSLLEHAVHALTAAGVDRVVVAVAADRTDAARELLGPSVTVGPRDGLPDGSVPVTVVTGGADRVTFLSAALNAALSGAAPSAVLVHDAARAFQPREVIRSVIDAVLAGAHAVVPVLPVSDTIRRADGAGRSAGLVDRELRRAG